MFVGFVFINLNSYVKDNARICVCILREMRKKKSNEKLFINIDNQKLPKLDMWGSDLYLVKLGKNKTREIVGINNNKKKVNLKHLVDIASTKHLVHICKLLWFICWKIWSKNTILSTPSPQKLACSTRWGCTLLSTTTFLHQF